MAPDAGRCSSSSLALDEPQLATASTVTRWILLEQPGPWGRNALWHSRMPAGFGQELVRRTRPLGIRVILIRRPGRSSSGGSQCFLARTRVDPWMERARLSSVEEVLDVDLDAFAGGEPQPFGERDADPLFMVCTNGRRDPCCAERGLPLVRALDPAFGDRAWECSHIGGDRFAGNLVCFPHGLYFGRVGPEEAATVAARYAAGHVDLAHYRGRSCYSMPVQAAEHFARVTLGLTGIDALRVESARRGRPDLLRVEFRLIDGRGLTVVVRMARSGRPRRLTCHATELAVPPEYELVAVD